MRKKIFGIAFVLAGVLVLAGAGCANNADKKEPVAPAVVPVVESDVSKPTGQAIKDEEKCIEATAYVFWLYQLAEQKDEAAVDALTLKMDNLKKQYGWADEDYNKICDKFGKQGDFMVRAGKRAEELIFGIASSATTSPPAVVLNPETLIAQFNLERFRNKKWHGEIKQMIEGTVAVGPIITCRDAHILLSANFTMEIDEMAIDFNNLSWAVRAKKLGIGNVASSTAVTITGTGKIKFQNPWRLFMTPTDQTVITSSPLLISFIGYIDFANNKLMPLEKFTNHPMLSEKETVCPFQNIPEPCPLGCMTNSGSSEWEAEKIWLRGMTFKFGSNNELILKEPIWNLAEFIWQRQFVLNSPLFHEGKVNFDASGNLKIKSLRD